MRIEWELRVTFVCVKSLKNFREIDILSFYTVQKPIIGHRQYYNLISYEFGRFYTI